MSLLLDSHVALWWLGNDRSLGAAAAEAIEMADDVRVSVITPWELGIRQAAGKLECPADLIPALLRAGFKMLPISTEHAERAPSLPMHHRDPFDRMLIAQAEIESLVIVTADDALGQYGQDVIDARR
jgi:PIN domain nuclease of toxin-antitoxin system